MRWKHLIAGAAAFILPVAAPAFGHAGFLVPVLDDSMESGEVILHASFSDTFPGSDIALKSEAWTIIHPDGTTGAFDRLVERPAHTILQATLTAPGTYRLSSGERLGRKGEVAKIGDAYVRLGRDGVAAEDLPDGATVLTSQTATVSDIYISRGEPGGDALGAQIGDLAITPHSIPAGLSANEAFTADIRFRGEPLPAALVTHFRPSGSREEEDPATQLTTSETGSIEVSLAEPGEHLLMVRHLAPAPAGSETDVRSYTTVLTLLVAP
ncbi:MAG: DUF4198 domain-containing protein [Pseudomonadota bacterium]